MREILFRGKRTDNGEWWCGSLLYDEENDQAFIAKHFEDKAAYLCAVAPDTVGQYTGLTDKNGKKIFEGDICQIKGISYLDETPFVIKWNNEFSGWFWVNLDFSAATDTITAEIAETCKIIGNIHDNPELLKGE